MAHFVLELGSDGRVGRVLRDGQPVSSSLRLEQLFSVVTTYFGLARRNLRQMRETSDEFERREYGLQAFLMSLTGLEAFTNVYFHVRGQELANPTIVDRVQQPHGTLSRKLRVLIAMTGDPPMSDQDVLLDQIHALSQLRNEVVHPRWEPSSLLISGGGPIVINGLVENRQALFESEQLCREALFWSLLVIASIAESRGNSDVSGFMFHWTGNFGLSLAGIREELGLVTAV